MSEQTPLFLCVTSPLNAETTCHMSTDSSPLACSQLDVPKPEPEVRTARRSLPPGHPRQRETVGVQVARFCYLRFSLCPKTSRTVLHPRPSLAWLPAMTPCVFSPAY